MKIKILYGVAAGIVALSLLAFSNSGPQTYDDCILANMKDAQTNDAAKLIRHSCRAKFYESENPFDETQRIIQ